MSTYWQVTSSAKSGSRVRNTIVLYDAARSEPEISAIFIGEVSLKEREALDKESRSQSGEGDIVSHRRDFQLAYAKRRILEQRFDVFLDIFGGGFRSVALYDLSVFVDEKFRKVPLDGLGAKNAGLSTL